MSAQEQWIAEFSRMEDERVEQLVEHAGGLFRQLGEKLGVQFDDYRAPAQAGLWLNPTGMRVGVVADVRDDPAKVFLGTDATADNVRPRAYLAVIGECRHCGTDAPLQPHILTEHDNDEARAKAGLALMMREPEAHHQCHITQVV